jgi:transaldolase
MTDIFLDTANLEEIEEILSWGIIEGVTTNQKIFLKEKGCNFQLTAMEILELVYPLPVSLEGPNDYKGIIKMAKEYSEWRDNNDNTYSNIVVKVPMLGNGDGIRAVKTLNEMGVRTNVTACMTLNQAFLAASVGATFVSLFYNRMKDWYGEQNKCSKEECTTYALSTIAQTMGMLNTSEFETELIVGSIRNPTDVSEILMANPDIITIPTKILKQMPFNEKTEYTLKEFEKCWEEFKKAEKND